MPPKKATKKAAPKKAQAPRKARRTKITDERRMFLRVKKAVKVLGGEKLNRHGAKLATALGIRLANAIAGAVCDMALAGKKKTVKEITVKAVAALSQFGGSGRVAFGQQAAKKKAPKSVSSGTQTPKKRGTPKELAYGNVIRMIVKAIRVRKLRIGALGKDEIGNLFSKKFNEIIDEIAALQKDSNGKTGKFSKAKFVKTAVFGEKLVASKKIDMKSRKRPLIFEKFPYVSSDAMGEVLSLFGRRKESQSSVPKR